MKLSKGEKKVRRKRSEKIDGCVTRGKKKKVQLFMSEDYTREKMAGYLSYEVKQKVSTKK